MVAEGEWVGLWIDDLDPRRPTIAEWCSEKLSLHLSQCSVLLYGLLCLSAMSRAEPHTYRLMGTSIKGRKMIACEGVCLLLIRLNTLWVTAE